ncbi:C13 family peptidase [Cellvibrio sp. UBA7661]|uniref:C13 family peptidase n=1 Tax=Cellvibrio sp. UBA7661 TaxID=1946311 RepID=UPI002F355879
MKRMVLLAFSFCTGVVLTLMATQGTFRDLRFAFSPVLNFADGATYVGDLNTQGQLEGQGRMRWSNGDEYDGEFLAELMHGKGTFTSVYSGSYTGNYVRGQMEGRGVLTYPDGSRYEGEFVANQFHGNGVLTYPRGDRYEGEFEKNKMHGRGKWLFADKSFYIGQVAEGIIQGKGELTRVTGEKYTGTFFAGKMHGQGVFNDGQGNQYSGDFVADNFTGSGAYTSNDGFTYVGEFKNWLLNGKGIQTDTTGNHWEGEYQDGQLEGNGSYSEKNGERYTGEFQSGKYNGQGKLIASNGDIYEGGFAYGRKHGKGTLIYQTPIDGIGRIDGRWEYDRLVDGGDTVKIFTPEEVAEYALYKEANELELVLNSLQVSNPNKIELYSLVVAGYGLEEVFRRESKIIENLFSAQYENRATAIYLANSQRSLNERPMATLTSISASISRIAERMDKDNDIFFLYITSHGSKNKKISLHHNGLELADIDSKWLAGQLKASGIKHRVVVLSACYSGGFIDDLKDENSLIMTAASADKTSFGCADDSRSTYFGRAYFQESLKPGIDFEQAFYQAKSLVESWEKEQKIIASEPQIVPNPNVLAQVKLWQQGLGAPVSIDLKP